jgi:hypothetical protein
MTIQDMHYNYKSKLNKIDSNKYRGMKIPEIDVKLNEAQELFITMIAEPRMKTLLGFETSQRSIDDIRTIVVDNQELILGVQERDSRIATLPDDYMYYIGDKLICSKGECNNKKLITHIIQHSDRNNDTSFYKSSFEWREANIRFFSGGIKIFNEDFDINSYSINYIRTPVYMNHSEGFSASGYYLADGVTHLTVSQNCELPEQTHREIVDVAVLLTTGDLEIPNAYQIKRDRLKLNGLINN